MTKIRGFGLVELIVAAAIIALVGTGAAMAWDQYIRLTQVSAGLTQAALLSEEAGEALEFTRDQSWNGLIKPLSLGTPYYIYWNGAAYATSTSPVVIDGAYTVSFTLSSVGRDANGNVVSSGGTSDPDTLLATIAVSQASSTSPISSSQLLIHDVYQN